MKTLFVTLALLLLAPSSRAGADCINEEERARLAEDKRVRRAGLERDFAQAGRHELSAAVGYYVPGQFDGTYVISGTYGYHLIEQLGLEASFAWTHLHSSVAARLEADRGVTVLPPDDRVFLIFADLVWTPLHGKAQLFSDAIIHFDVSGSLGGGIIDSSTSVGAAGRAGLGLKLWLARGLAIRLDLRDQVYRQQVLSTLSVVQDFSLSLGLSLLLPWSQ